PNNPIAVPLFSIGKIKNIIVCISGIIIPAPDACNTRPANKSENVGATAQRTVPKKNKDIAVKNNRRVVYRSIKNAVTGIIIPFTSIKDDCNHCTVLSVMSRSTIITGKAVPNNVWFNIVINAPDNNTKIKGKYFR